MPEFDRAAMLELMAKKPKRERTIRREATRRSVALAHDQERLFRLGPGGSAERPVDLASASVVEIRARAAPCPRCAGTHHVDEHLAVTIHGVQLREARLSCRSCGSTRSLWFRLPTLN